MAGIELNPHFKNLFVSLVCLEPQQRLSISELKNHPWLWNARQTLDVIGVEKSKNELKEIYADFTKEQEMEKQ